MQITTSYSPYGQVVHDDEDRFLAAFFRDDPGVSIQAGGTDTFPDDFIDAPGFEVPDIAEWFVHEQSGSGAYEVDGSGMRMSVTEIAYGTLARFAVTLPGYSYEGAGAGLGRLCASLVEIDSENSPSYELSIHFGDDKEDIYDFWLGDEGREYHLARRS